MPQTITLHRMASIVGLLLCFALPCCSNAQWNPLNPVNDVKRDANGVTLDDARRNAAHSGGQRIDRASDLFGDERISRFAAIHDHENQLAAGAVGHAIQR